MQSCTYCFKESPAVSKKYLDRSGNGVCAHCSIGNIVDLNPVDLLVYHDTYFLHGSQMQVDTEVNPSLMIKRSRKRLHDMPYKLMQIHGCIDSG